MSVHTKILAGTVATVLLHAAIALATSSETFFYVMVGSSQPLFGGSVDTKAIYDDVEIYYRYATQALMGQIPYRDYVIEYPLLAFPLFFLPRVFVEDFEGYTWAFGAEMLLFDAAAVYLVARWVARREGLARVPGRLAWYSVCVLAFGSLIVARFDFAPTFLALAATLAWASGQNLRG
ncbi:MAG: hypothetical protein IRY99_18925, partial [Isosphaeraceae bacterium]|nr:hypothetical protein [Isosphaeraceae bacterium]